MGMVQAMHGTCSIGESRKGLVMENGIVINLAHKEARMHVGTTKCLRCTFLLMSVQEHGACLIA